MIFVVCFAVCVVAGIVAWVASERRLSEAIDPTDTDALERIRDEARDRRAER